MTNKLLTRGIVGPWHEIIDTAPDHVKSDMGYWNVLEYRDAIHLADGNGNAFDFTWFLYEEYNQYCVDECYMPTPRVIADDIKTAKEKFEMEMIRFGYATVSQEEIDKRKILI